MECHCAPGMLQQLWLAVRYGLTYKLFTLSSRIEAIKVKIEVRWNPHLFYSLNYSFGAPLAGYG
jgi:hypothetical protein